MRGLEVTRGGIDGLKRLREVFSGDLDILKGKIALLMKECSRRNV